MEPQPIQGYFFQSYITKPNVDLFLVKKEKIIQFYYSHHMNMHQGAWIDIFPYDKVSNNKIKRRIDYSIFLVRKNMYIEIYF